MVRRYLIRAPGLENPVALNEKDFLEWIWKVGDMSRWLMRDGELRRAGVKPG
jgi:hypothetical protein